MMVPEGGRGMQIQVIARISSRFPDKFGIPRQAGLVPSLRARVVFEREYAVPEAVRGLEGFTHVWLLWGFSGAGRAVWSPTVRPPRLGGEKRVGVFASRSPFRPNGLGLSCVTLLGIEKGEGTLALIVGGADLMDGTPIYDVKPYLRYADCRPDAGDGFAVEEDGRLEVRFPDHLLARLPEGDRQTVTDLLRLDPRPAYQEDPERQYGFRYGDHDIRFRVREGLCQVVDVVDLTGGR